MGQLLVWLVSLYSICLLLSAQTAISANCAISKICAEIAEIANCAHTFQQLQSLITNGLKNKPLHPTDFLRTHSLPFSNILKSPQKLIPRSFLLENQCCILNCVEWHFVHFVHLGHFRKSLKCTKCTKCQMFFISVFIFTKECLNTSIDTSTKNNNIKTHPLA